MVKGRCRGQYRAIRYAFRRTTRHACKGLLCWLSIRLRILRRISLVASWGWGRGAMWRGCRRWWNSWTSRAAKGCRMRLHRFSVFIWAIKNLRMESFYLEGMMCQLMLEMDLQKKTFSGLAKLIRERHFSGLCRLVIFNLTENTNWTVNPNTSSLTQVWVTP